MSRTYKLRRHDGSDFQGVRKEWVLVNKRGAKKYQQMVNKRCRRLDKLAIAEGINDMIDDAEEVVAVLEEIFFDEWDEWYEEDPYEEEVWDSYEEEVWDEWDSHEEEIWDPYEYYPKL